MAFVQEAFFDPNVPLKIRQEALDRAFADPGLPAPRGMPSFWLQEPPFLELATAQSASLAPEAEVVIIGSGITGTSIARTLLANASTRKSSSAVTRPAVVMLDSREACHGATGRNGGHILETAEEFSYFEATYGVEAAIKTMRFRLAHLTELLRVAEEYGVSEIAQARRVEFLSVHFDEAKWAETVRSIRRLKECMPAETAEWKIFEKDAIPKEFHLAPHARGIIAGPAGAMWPYRFVTGMLARLCEQHSNDLLIETRTPVTEIHAHAATDAGLRYAVTTPRGTIRARHVVHCTNAHVGHLVPGLRGRIYPIQGTMTAQKPGRDFPPQGTRHSWLFNYERGFDYLTQLPAAGAAASETANKMMLGGGFAQHEDRGVLALGVASDERVPADTLGHLRGALRRVFDWENWGDEAIDGGDGGIEAAWTGNMGFSADGYPWIGRLPVSATSRGENEVIGDVHGAEWLSCAFSGEGMVQAWLCGKAVGLMVLAHDGRLAGEQTDLSWVPEQMLVTEERIKRSVLPRRVPNHRPSQL
ncbi:NAD(P)/FAD-dependent oxidoreductase [Aspergillus homomorphus CBS 101889]|uniref:DAO-domain-containing protein n=1 Tax=Aspergillus homomorphus (strain CBS 101889) TaxID=1450537 RepID=A0A395HIY3_ASPHC|nr:DAO-domain-containing protein [Aspergillus homomorphus CBS 101889]RAL07393.1 DAO-domain-containing protein [Aspergillus homomorphus CBS 101889]